MLSTAHCMNSVCLIIQTSRQISRQEHYKYEDYGCWWWTVVTTYKVLLNWTIKGHFHSLCNTGPGLNLTIFAEYFPGKVFSNICYLRFIYSYIFICISKCFTMEFCLDFLLLNFFWKTKTWFSKSRLVLFVCCFVFRQPNYFTNYALLSD